MSRKQARPPQNVAEEMAKAIETVRLEKGDVETGDLNGLGFTTKEIAAFGDDARAIHARTYQVAA
jgi:hypothetical protein